MNKLLLRQINKQWGGLENVPLEIQSFLQKVSETYDHYERDRSILERAIDVTSDEVMGLYDRLRTESKELEKAHEDLQALFRNIEKVFFTVDVAQSKVVQMSPSCEKIYGYTAEEFLNDNNTLWFDVVLEEDKHIIEANYPLMFAGKSFSHAHRIKAKDGTIRWIETMITPTLNPDGQVVRIDGITSDITAKKEAEAQLEYDRRNRDALINSTNDLMWSFDSDSRLIAANSAFIDAVKYVSGKDLHIGDRLTGLDVLPEATLNKWQTLYARVLSGESFIYENHETYPVEVWGELAFNPIIENGKVVGGSCFWRDITEKKRIQQQVEASARMMADAQRVSRFGSWEVKFNEKEEFAPDSLTWTNEMYRIFGLDPETYVPRAGGNTVGIHPNDVDLVNDWFVAVKMGEAPGSIDYRINTPDGQRRWVKTTADLIRDPKTGQRIKLLGTVQDITERKTLERERNQVTKDLVQRNKALEQFAHIVSHNLRAPVANILGLSNLIKLSQNNPDTQRQCIDGLTLSAKRLDEIILDLSKILQVKQGMSEEKDMVQLDTLVSNIQDSIQMIIQQENVAIVTDFKEVSQIYTIKNYLHSIFFNLISNSIKYRRHSVRPVIEISSRYERGKTVLTFKDNCMGIDLEKHGHAVFGLYKRFHLNVEGKGMGMYMVKTQVESLGGKIGIQSKVDHGTEFTIVL